MTLIVIETEEESASSIEEPPPLPTPGAPSPSNQDIFSSPLLPHTKHQRQSLRPPFSGRQHILHCGASLDAAHMLYGAGHPCTIQSPPKPTNLDAAHHHKTKVWDDVINLCTKNVCVIFLHATRQNDQSMPNYGFCQQLIPLWLNLHSYNCLSLHSFILPSIVCVYSYCRSVFLSIDTQLTGTRLPLHLVYACKKQRNYVVHFICNSLEIIIMLSHFWFLIICHHSALWVHVQQTVYMPRWRPGGWKMLAFFQWLPWE